MSQEARVIVNLRISRAARGKLDKLAKKHGTTRAEVLRALLATGLSHTGELTNRLQQAEEV